MYYNIICGLWFQLENYRDKNITERDKNIDLDTNHII